MFFECGINPIRPGEVKVLGAVRFVAHPVGVQVYFVGNIEQRLAKLDGARRSMRED